MPTSAQHKCRATYPLAGATYSVSQLWMKLEALLRCSSVFTGMGDWWGDDIQNLRLGISLLTNLKVVVGGWLVVGVQVGVSLLSS